MLQHKLKILALSGSLRASSSNAVILEAIERMLPEDIDFFIYKGIGSLPHFDDAEQVPIAVTVWRKHLQDADAVLICSLKNALDWTVSSGELVNKPLALITAATGGEKAHAAWLQVFTALSARIPAGGALLVPFVRSKLGANGSITDEGTRQAVEQLLHNLIATAKESVA